MNLAVLASGRGSNFVAIAAAVAQNKIKAKLRILVCDQPGAPVISRARELGIRVVVVSRADFYRRADFEEALIRSLEEYKIDLIVLAGFMRLLSPDFVRRFHKRIINIHPSLLPAFKGKQAIKDAFSAGAPYTGVSVHFVDEQVDHGALILQQRIRILKSDTLLSLEKKIHAVEHKLYPRAINLYLRYGKNISCK